MVSKKRKTTEERGKYKIAISRALYKNEDIRNLIVGDCTTLSANESRTKFKSRVKSHLFIDDTITETGSYIFYDINIPNLASQIKTCRIVMYIICSRDILETYSKEGYYGDRADILSQMIEDTLINDKEIVNEFGIGELRLDSIEIYNSSRFYGCIMNFEIPTFR